MLHRVLVYHIPVLAEYVVEARRQLVIVGVGPDAGAVRCIIDFFPRLTVENTDSESKQILIIGIVGVVIAIIAFICVVPFDRKQIIADPEREILEFSPTERDFLLLVVIGSFFEAAALIIRAVLDRDTELLRKRDLAGHAFGYYRTKHNQQRTHSEEVSALVGADSGEHT